MTRPSPEAALAGALLGTFAGDALGATFEGSRPSSDGHARIERALSRGELTYTDDTQLAIALAEHLCEHPDVDPSALRDTILEHFEPWRGYGGGMHRLVHVWRDGVPIEEAATAVFPEGSFGNGAAMRVAPVGALWRDDPERLDAAARRQASLTHAHPLGIDSAVLQARAVGLAAATGTFGPDELRSLAEVVEEAELFDELERAIDLLDGGPQDPAEVAGILGTAVVGHRSVPAALWSAAVGDTVEDAIALALGLGGDADTIAAMAGAVSGSAHGPDALPRTWLDQMEAGPRGVDHVRDLARRLAEVAGQ